MLKGLLAAWGFGMHQPLLCTQLYSHCWLGLLGVGALLAVLKRAVLQGLLEVELQRLAESTGGVFVFALQTYTRSMCAGAVGRSSPAGCARVQGGCIGRAGSQHRRAGCIPVQGGLSSPNCNPPCNTLWWATSRFIPDGQITIRTLHCHLAGHFIFQTLWRVNHQILRHYLLGSLIP